MYYHFIVVRVLAILRLEVYVRVWYLPEVTEAPDVCEARVFCCFPSCHDDVNRCSSQPYLFAVADACFRHNQDGTSCHRGSPLGTSRCSMSQGNGSSGSHKPWTSYTAHISAGNGGLVHFNLVLYKDSSATHVHVVIISSLYRPEPTNTDAQIDAQKYSKRRGTRENLATQASPDIRAFSRTTVSWVSCEWTARSPSSAARVFLRPVRKKRARAPRTAPPAKPPTVPPAIAPVFTVQPDDVYDVEDSGEDVGCASLTLKTVSGTSADPNQHRIGRRGREEKRDVETTVLTEQVLGYYHCSCRVEGAASGERVGERPVRDRGVVGHHARNVAVTQGGMPSATRLLSVRVCTHPTLLWFRQWEVQSSQLEI